MAKFDNADEVEQSTLEQPDPLAAITGTLKLWKMKNKRWPDSFPPAPMDAAAAWMTFQEPATKIEQSRRIPIPQERGKPVLYRWEAPYIDRISANLRAFLHENRNSQSFIMAAIDDGIAYRGDDNSTPYPQFNGLTLFQNIVKENEIMREVGVEAYREQSKLKARASMRRMASK